MLVNSRFWRSPIIFIINEFDLLWVPNFIALGIYIILVAKFNEGIDTYFNVECVFSAWKVNLRIQSEYRKIRTRKNSVFGHFSRSGYLAIILIFLVVTARYAVVTAGYCSLPDGYWWLLFVTARYCSFPQAYLFSHVLTYAIKAFWLTSGVLAFAKFVEFLKESPVKAGLNVFSYFPTWKYAYFMLKF